MNALRIDVWSDIACPWCYVGKRRFEAALARFSDSDRVQLVWRSFELSPGQVDRAPGDYVDRLARKYRVERGEADTMIARMVEVGRAEGLVFDFQRIQAASTFDAHRLLHLAKSHGLQNLMKERLFAAYFAEGASLGDRATLVRLGTEVGLNPDEVRGKLQEDALAKEVRLDQREAEAIGIRGVPFFVLGGRYAVSGAQPTDVLLDALEQARNLVDGAPEAYAAGATCGPDGC